METLATEIGERSYAKYDQLELAADAVSKLLGAACSRKGKRPCRVHVQTYTIDSKWRRAIARHSARRCGAKWKPIPLDHTFKNLEVVIEGTNPRLPEIVVGAHYDSDTCESRGVNPGADDNASGVAALVELVRSSARTPRESTIRFVAFTNEEEPFFQTCAMGSYVYARALKEELTKEQSKIAAMVSLETLGFYVDEGGSQDHGPLEGLFDFPDTGNFVAIVGNPGSRSLVQRVASTLKAARTRVPVEGIVAWPFIPGVGWSDHWSFWKIGVPAVMVTDTALNRNHCYHHSCDVPGRLDYAKLAAVVKGMDEVLTAIAKEAKR